MRGGSGRETATSFRASPGQHLAPAARRHTGSEAMVSGALYPAGLKGSFHDSVRFAAAGLQCLNPGARILVVLGWCCNCKRVVNLATSYPQVMQAAREVAKKILTALSFRIPRHCPCNSLNRDIKLHWWRACSQLLHNLEWQQPCR